MKTEDLRSARDAFLRQIAKENVNPGVNKTQIAQVISNIVQYCETHANEMDAVLPPEIAPLLNAEMRARFWATAMATIHETRKPPAPGKLVEAEVPNGPNV